MALLSSFCFKSVRVMMSCLSLKLKRQRIMASLWNVLNCFCFVDFVPHKPDASQGPFVYLENKMKNVSNITGGDRRTAAVAKSTKKREIGVYIYIYININSASMRTLPDQCYFHSPVETQHNLATGQGKMP